MARQRRPAERIGSLVLRALSPQGRVERPERIIAAFDRARTASRLEEGGYNSLNPKRRFKTAG
jgi:hypothetical protein